MSHKEIIPPIEFISEQRATAVHSLSFITSSRGTKGREFFQEQKFVLFFVFTSRILVNGTTTFLETF